MKSMAEIFLPACSAFRSISVRFPPLMPHCCSKPSSFSKRFPLRFALAFFLFFVLITFHPLCSGKFPIPIACHVLSLSPFSLWLPCKLFSYIPVLSELCPQHCLLIAVPSGTTGTTFHVAKKLKNSRKNEGKRKCNLHWRCIKSCPATGHLFLKTHSSCFPSNGKWAPMQAVLFLMGAFIALLASGKARLGVAACRWHGALWGQGCLLLIPAHRSGTQKPQLLQPWRRLILQMEISI